MLIKKDPDLLKTYLEDSSNLKGGYAEEAVLPESADELSSFLKEADAKKLPVTISGGGTNTTGSRIPFGGAVLSLEKLNKVVEVSRAGMSAILQTGVMVDDLKKACETEELFYTCHPTENTASVGGTVATNASGARSFKYGSTRKYVRSLKMVLPSGEMFNIRRGERILSKNDSRITLGSGRVIDVPLPAYKMPNVKSSAGYFAKDGMDLIDLFIGQEGTLSVIVEIGMGLVGRPSKILSSFVFFRTEEDAWRFAAEAREISKRNDLRNVQASISALSIEYFSREALGLLQAKKTVLPKEAQGAIFFEQEVEPGKKEDAVLDEWLKLIVKHDSSADDTWVAMTEKETENFLALRHAIPESVNDIVRRNGFRKISTDIAVPDGTALEMMRFYTDTLKGEALEHVIFGHIGENHVHANILPRSEEEDARGREIAMKFIRKGISLGGTVSAEHGIGKIKHKYLEEMYGKAGILEMARIKKAFDPNCILGLDNIFPKEVLSLA